MYMFAVLKLDELIGDAKTVFILIGVVAAILAVVGIMRGHAKAGVMVLVGLLVATIVLYVAQNPDGVGGKLGRAVEQMLD